MDGRMRSGNATSRGGQRRLKELECLDGLGGSRTSFDLASFSKHILQPRLEDQDRNPADPLFFSIFAAPFGLTFNEGERTRERGEERGERRDIAI
jgi:hypothetical protein